MRGDKTEQAAVMLFITPDQKVPQDHPIRAIKPIVDRALTSLSPVFNRMYSKRGRPSIPPEHLLKASLLIALYSVRSERQFCERLEYDLLFKWFLDQNIDTPAFDASTFSKNRQRLLDSDVARQFFAGQTGLVVLIIETRRLDAELKWENSASPAGVSAEATFPHVFGPIGLDAVVRAVDLEPNGDGDFRLPQLPAENGSGKRD